MEVEHKKARAMQWFAYSRVQTVAEASKDAEARGTWQARRKA